MTATPRIPRRSDARPALRYYGGKWAIAPKIIPLLPPCECYVEPFAGGASLLLHPARPHAPIEVYNDADEAVWTFFSVLRDGAKRQELIRALRWTPFHRLNAGLDLDDAEVGDVEIARRFYTRSWQTRGGVRDGRSGWRYRAAVNNRTMSAVDELRGHLRHLVAIGRRLRRVQIDCCDAVECMRRYDRPTTLFYVDPPYLGSTRGTRWEKAYRADMTTAEEHVALLEAVLALRAMVVLSGYASALYDDALADWRRVELSARTDVGGEATEVLWINPAAGAALDAARRQGQLFAGGAG